MAGPWEKFASTQTESGPWTKFRPVEKAPDPTEGNSFFENALAGVGSAFTDIGLGAKQRLDDAAAYLERTFEPKSITSLVTGQQKPTSMIGKVGEYLGMPTAAKVVQETQAAVDEKRRIDAPLMETIGGKVGNFGGKVIPALAASMLPGGQTLAGSMLTGGALNAVEPTATGESFAKNMAVGAATGGLGYGAGKLIGKGVEKASASAAASRAAKEGSRNAVRTAQEAGYILPPSQSNPTLINRTLEGLSGKVATAQAASLQNQGVTNRLAAKAVGLADDAPITKEALANIRTQAGDAYSAVKGFGTVQADDAYRARLQDIAQKYRGAAKDFPELAADEVEKIVSSVNRPSFGADSAIDAIGILRERATAAYTKGDKTLGKAYRAASEAMEELVERNLAATGRSDLLKSFKDARQKIAKSYSLEKALNAETGDVSAKVLAGQLTKGKPLSGELKTIARAGQAFPKATEQMRSSVPGISPLDFYGAGGLTAATGNPLPFLVAGARPLVRSVILSAPYQRTMATPSVGLLGRIGQQQAEKLTSLLSASGGILGATTAPGLLNF